MEHIDDEMDFEPEVTVPIDPASTSPSKSAGGSGKLKRSASANSQSNMSLSSESLVIQPGHTSAFLKSLECPICLETVIPPVMNCTSGHIVCSLCRPKVKKCALCNAAFTNSRNYAIEGILAVVDINCRFENCNVKIQVDKLATHMGVCDYRPVKCYETQNTHCKGKEIAYTSYLQHLTRDHRLLCKSLDEAEFRRVNISNALPVKWPVFMFKLHGQAFLLHRIPSESNTSLCVWITLLAKEEEAIKNIFRVKILPPNSKNNPVAHFEWKIRAHSVHKTMKEVVESCDCVVLSTEMITPFCERRAAVSNLNESSNVYEYKWSMSVTLESESET